MEIKTLKELDPSFDLLEGSLMSSLEGISHTQNPRPNTFVFIKNNKFLKEFLESLSAHVINVGAIFQKDFYDSLNSKDELKAISWLATVSSVQEAMCLFSKPFYDEKFNHLNYFVDGRQMNEAQIDPFCDIAQNVFIGVHSKIEKGVKIYPGAVIMPHVEIGENTIIYPNVVIYPYSKIGKNCRIHSSTVIGADGFGYHFFKGAHQKIWHFSGVEIGDEVEIGASSTIDAGAFTPTLIGSGTKIDNGVQIGHNAKLGKHVILCGQVGISGSVRLDDYVVMGGNSGVAPGAHLEKGTLVAARGVVSENTVWGPGSKIAGHPAEPLSDWLRNKAKLRLLLKKSEK